LDEKGLTLCRIRSLLSLTGHQTLKSQDKENPNVAKAGGLQSQGVKGEVVVVYLESLTTQDLKSSGFPEG
jgi:hypothetical protein